MRVGLWVGVLVVALFAAVMTTGTVAGVLTERQQARTQPRQVANISCNAALGPTGPRDGSKGAVDAANLTRKQRGIAALIISIGKQRGLSPRSWQIAIQAGMTESGLRNVQHGHADSLGIFQMRPSMGWGTPAQVTDPTYAINKFYDVLETVPNWQQMRPGVAAQAVERSAFPARYHRWEAMAAYLVENIGDVEDVTGCGQGSGLALPPNDAAKTAIQYAKDQLGEPYVWGAEGPDAFDCSGLVLQAYRAAGIALPRVAENQYNAGAMLPVEQAQPGDLLFWAYDPSDPRTIHHVAIYLGDGKILEAEQTGVPVQIDTFSWDGAQLVPQAVRPGV